MKEYSVAPATFQNIVGLTAQPSDKLDSSCGIAQKCQDGFVVLDIGYTHSSHNSSANNPIRQRDGGKNLRGGRMAR